MNESIGSMVFWGAFWLVDVVAMCWLVGNHDRPVRRKAGPDGPRFRPGFRAVESIAEQSFAGRWRNN